MKQKQSSFYMQLWLAMGAFLILAMVVIGGITRLTGSGLSMVEWNVISGTLPPFSEPAWQQAFAKYQQFPEFKKLNFTMTLAGFKQIFWWEYLHRLLGRIIGVVFFLPFLYFMCKRLLKGWLMRRLLFVMFLGMCQGVMGWLMVKSGLVDNPHVSHYRLAAHLCLALALIGTLVWTIADVRSKTTGQKHTEQSITFRSILVLLSILLQIILGAFVAGLKAGYYQNTYPLMNGEFFPSYLVSFLTWRNFLENGSAIQFTHRWVAIGVLGIIVQFWLKSRKAAISHSIKLAILWLFSIALIQVALGIATLVLHVPIVLGVLHQIVAVVLFSTAVWIVHELRATYSQSHIKHSIYSKAAGIMERV